jgi:hypothetical protein
MDLSKVASSAMTGLVGFGVMAQSCSCIFGCKKREYSTANNKIKTNALMKKLPENVVSFSEVYINSEWVPIDGVGCCFMTNLHVTTSEYDPNNQTFQITVSRPCCLPWSWFEQMLQSDASEWAAPDDVKGTHSMLPVELNFAEFSNADQRFPGWDLFKKSVFKPDTPESELVVADDVAHFMKGQLHSNGSGVFLLRGPPRCGKSSAGLRLAQMLGNDTLICEKFRPATPGHLLNNLIEVRNQHDPEASIVFLFDEADGMFASINSDKTILQTPGIVTEITGKDGWNPWADGLTRFKKVVFVMTMNADDDKMARMDPSFFREDRVTAHIKVHHGGFDAVHRRKVAVPFEHGQVMTRDADANTPLLP